MASGGLSGIVSSFTGGGVLGNILTGAITQAGYGALMGGAIGAMTGAGFGKGALMGAAAGGISGGLFGAAGLNPDPLTWGAGDGTGVVAANTPTGMAPTGTTDIATQRVSQAFSNGASPAPAPAAPTGGGGFAQFMNSETGGGLLAGLGKGLGSYMEAQAAKEAAQADRDFLRDKEQRLQDSYNVDPSALHSAPEDVSGTGRPVPAQKYARKRYEYVPEEGRIMLVQA
ncbi:MAG TPA: hypothetical protein VJU81_16710 [Methylomirabilota bacterium]|nr:hypothetical protein [Methylomirabilota bacterium]